MLPNILSKSNFINQYYLVCLGYLGDYTAQLYGIKVNHSEDPHEPTNIMKCYWRVLITALLMITHYAASKKARHA